MPQVGQHSKQNRDYASTWKINLALHDRACKMVEHFKAHKHPPLKPSLRFQNHNMLHKAAIQLSAQEDSVL